MTQVTIAVIGCRTEDSDDKRLWTVRGRIVEIERVTPKKPVGEGNWFSVAKAIRQLVDIKFTTKIPERREKVLLPNVTLKTGNLANVKLTDADLESILDILVSGEDRVHTATVDCIYPMRVPCVRVPLTLLEELRGPYERVDQSRKALIETWRNDRHTGVPKGKDYRVR